MSRTLNMVLGGYTERFKTATGAIVSFLTRRIAPLKIEAELEPKQDLNGYDAPWPPGGGKNKWSGDATFSKDNSATYTPQVITAIPAGTYTISGLFTTESTGNKVRFSFRTTSPVNVSITANSGSRTSATFTLAEDCTTVRVYGQDNTTERYAATFANVQVCLSTATDPEVYSPYSNNCPISGHTGADIFVEPEYDASADPTVTVTFGQTVYGGTLTVNEDGSGSVVANMAIEDLGNGTWQKSSNSRYMYSTLISADVKRPATASTYANAICSHLVRVSASGVDTDNDNNSFGIATNGNIRVKYHDFPQDPTTFKTAVTGWKVCYELATPITITLSPGEVDALLGNNTVWVDDSNSISVTYRSN